MVVQAALITSPKGYAGSIHISAQSIFSSMWFYAKSLTYAWQNGFSKPAQVWLAVVLTGFAGIGFGRHVLREASVDPW